MHYHKYVWGVFLFTSFATGVAIGDDQHSRMMDEQL